MHTLSWSPHLVMSVRKAKVENSLEELKALTNEEQNISAKIAQYSIKKLTEVKEGPWG